MIKKKFALFKNVIIASSSVRIFGKNIENNFSFQLNNNQINQGIKINFNRILSILYVKPTFTKGIFEIFYQNNYSQKVWFQIKLSKSWWVAGDLIVKYAKENYKNIKIIEYISIKEWKNRETRVYLNKKKNKR